MIKAPIRDLGAVEDCIGLLDGSDRPGWGVWYSARDPLSRPRHHPQTPAPAVQAA
jgi:hypothetical protein